MESGSLIGVLAIFTIGAGLIGAIAYFGYFLSNPKNREAAHRTLVRDEGSAANRSSDTLGSSLKTRLDNSEASAHPDDPTRAQPAP